MHSNRPSPFTKIATALLCYLPILLVQLTSARITFSSVTTWYPTLIKPPWNPPSWVFGPTWTVLYLLMAVALWLVVVSTANRATKNRCYFLFFLQLTLNFLWTPLFFGYQQVFWAAIDLALLVVSIGATMITFWKVRPLAGGLLLPYLLWSSYALSLNIAIWWLNP